MKRKKRKFKRRSIIQKHHLSYDPDVYFRTYSEEHFYISRIDMFKPPISKGFLKALAFFILRHENIAVDLDKIARKEEAKDIAKLKKVVK